jgi:sodium transport system ATP-binding protein
MIEVHDAAKRYRSTVALRGATVRAENGAITALIGANGSGKTTLLRSIAGLIDLDAGSVAIDGIAMPARRSAALRRLGFMPDGGGLYPVLTAREHVALFGRLHGLGGRALPAAVDAALERLGLVRIADRPTRGFSAGERMRVALARTIVQQPPNVVLDEPSRGLDLDGLLLLRTLLRDLRHDGTCVVLSSHVLSDVAVLADAVVLLHAGEVRATGSPAQLVAHTATASLEDAYVRITAEVPA